MSVHIIWTFVGMNKLRVIFWNQLIDKGLKIFPHRWIRNFIDGKGSRSMLDKNLEESDFYFSQFRKFLFDQIRDQMVS